MSENSKDAFIQIFKERNDLEMANKNLRAEVERLKADFAAQNQYVCEQDILIEQLYADLDQMRSVNAKLQEENSALVKTLDEATFVEEREKITARVVEDPFMPLTAAYVTESKGIVIERDYSRLTPDSIALCERLEKEVWK